MPDAKPKPIVKIYTPSVSTPNYAVCQLYREELNPSLEHLYQLAYIALEDVPRLWRKDILVQVLRGDLLEGALSVSFVAQIKELPESYRQVGLIHDHY